MKQKKIDIKNQELVNAKTKQEKKILAAINLQEKRQLDTKF